MSEFMDRLLKWLWKWKKFLILCNGKTYTIPLAPNKTIEFDFDTETYKMYYIININKQVLLKTFTHNELCDLAEVVGDEVYMS